MRASASGGQIILNYLPYAMLNACTWNSFNFTFGSEKSSVVAFTSYLGIGNRINAEIKQYN
jgi:hypothetical protein